MPVIKVEAETPGENKEDNVIPYMLGIVLRLSQLTFLAPVSLRRAYGRWAVVKIYPGLVICQRLLAFLFSVIAIPTLIHHYLGSKANAIFFTIIVICCHIILPMWAYNLAMLNSAGKLKRHITLLRQIQKINNSFKRTNVTKSRRIETWLLCLYITWQILEIVVVTLINLWYLSKGEYSRLLSIAVRIIIWYQNFVIGLQLLQWDLIVCEIKFTLSNLNDELQSWLESSTVTNISHIRKNMKTNRVNMKTSALAGLTNVHPRTSILHLSDCYEEICDLAQKVVEDNGTFLLLMIMLIFLHSLLTPYNFLVAIDSKDLVSMLRQGAWSLFHLCQLLTVVEPSHQLHQQQRRTRRIVCKLAGDMGRWDMNLAQLEPLLLQVQMQELQDAALAPMGLFRVGRPLVASMIGGVATSLIVIVQFKKMSDVV